MRRPFVIATIATALVLPPLALHTTLAVLLHRQIDAALVNNGEQLTLDHDDVSVGPFADSVTIQAPRVIWQGQSSPVMQASQLQLTRRNSLLGWLWDGRFDLELRISELAQNPEGLKARGATPAQLRAMRRLGFDDGQGTATIRFAYTPETARFTSHFDYTSDSGRSASLTSAASNVSSDDIAALGEWRMPAVGSHHIETQYSDDETHRVITALAQRSRLSESTLLRLLTLPVPYQWASAKLARQNLTLDRLHLGPMLSAIRVDGLAGPTLPQRAGWRLERARLDRLELVPVDGGVTVQRLRVRSQGLTLPLTSLRSELASLLRDAGYTQPTLSLTASYRHDPISEELALSEVTMTGNGMGKLDGELRLQGVNARQLARQPRAALIGSSVEGLNLAYSDTGLANRLMDALEARDDTQTTGRTALEAEVRGSLDATLGERVTGRLMPAFNTFLANPERLVLAAEPERPVSVRALIGLAFTKRYGAIAERLQLRAHNRSASAASD